MSNIWANRKVLFPKSESVDFFKLCSVANKVHEEVTWTLKSNSKRLKGLPKYSLWTLFAFLEKLLFSLDPPKNSTKCFMKLKFLPYSRITFIFSWLKYEEILKTLESQVRWLLQKMAPKEDLSPRKEKQNLWEKCINTWEEDLLWLPAAGRWLQSITGPLWRWDCDRPC